MSPKEINHLCMHILLKQAGWQVIDPAKVYRQVTLSVTARKIALKFERMK
jgi:hypothetical protein